MHGTIRAKELADAIARDIAARRGGDRPAAFQTGADPHVAGHPNGRHAAFVGSVDPGLEDIYADAPVYKNGHTNGHAHVNGFHANGFVSNGHHYQQNGHSVAALWPQGDSVGGRKGDRVAAPVSLAGGADRLEQGLGVGGIGGAVRTAGAGVLKAVRLICPTKLAIALWLAVLVVWAT